MSHFPQRVRSPASLRHLRARKQRDRSAFLLLAIGITAMACKEEPAQIRVKGPREALESVKMVPEFPPFEKKGDTIRLRASGFDKKGRFMEPSKVKVKWESSDSRVASVSQTGVVTVLSSGVAQIKATSIDVEKPVSGTMKIVGRILKSVKIVEPVFEEGKTTELPMGEELKFKAEVKNDRGQVVKDAKIKWSTSNYAATIGVGGTLEGRAIGTVQVVAETKNGLTDQVELMVTDWAKKKRRRR